MEPVDVDAAAAADAEVETQASTLSASGQMLSTKFPPIILHGSPELNTCRVSGVAASPNPATGIIHNPR